MPDARLDVLGVGNAIVDVIAKAEDGFLAAHHIPRGGMILIDETCARAIYDAMAPGMEISGGSAANTIACLASLGGKGAFAGKVADDELGGIFRHDLRAMGVEFDTAPLADGPRTGRCLVNVTPDAQRSMATFLGAAGHLAPGDIDAAQIERTRIVFFEGYLFEAQESRAAFIRASEIARACGARTAMTLSDAGVVERHGDVLRAFVKSHIDILLANEAEARALFESGDIAEIADKARALCPLAAVTRSEKGSILLPRDGAAVLIEAVAPQKLEDTTGAGDAYAAGLLFGLARDFALPRAGALGSYAASEAISHFGARPAQSLKALAQKAGLL